MTTIDSFNFSGKKALVRVDFNVPLNEAHQVTDDTRIRGAIPTIKKILKDGGAVILMSHLGRPKDGPDEINTMKHLLPVLKKLLNREVKFADDCIGQQASDLSKSLQPGEVLVLENTRFHVGETKGDRSMAEKLAAELQAAYKNEGSAVKKKDDTHRMAEANKAFSHFRF